MANSDRSAVTTIAEEAAKAAALVKTTAESTATNLNIQYIQKDIVEIKDTLKTIVATNDGRVDRITQRVDNLARMVYIGVGISIGISFLSPFLQKLVFK